MASASFTDFKQFYSTAFGFYCITMPENLNNSNFLQGTCTCPAYYKHYICKHILGIALRLSAQSPDLCDAKICIPNPAKNTSLKGTSRAPGRPPNAPSALKFVHEFVSILEEDANNDVFIPDDNETDAAIQAESNQLAAVSQPERVVDIVEAEAIENLLLNPAQKCLTQVYTQLNSTCSRSSITQPAFTQPAPIKYNKNGTVAKKRGPKPKVQV
jgi:hypothetical protein